MSVVTFPMNRTRAACYACFNFQTGNIHVCPVCGRGTGARLPDSQRPSRPSMFDAQPTTPAKGTPNVE